jgi:hypothetical protein
VKTILSLCDYTGIWSAPYREAGYNVLQIDIQKGDDVRLLEYPGPVHGIIAQPPCTHFAGSGARWWKDKGPSAILEGLQIVDACLRFVAVCSPAWWVLENPVGRLNRYLGPYQMSFHPHQYAGWAPDPLAEAYTKRTCLFGKFTPPETKDVGNRLGSIMHRVAPGPNRANIRSQTPQGFALAFFHANP